MISDDRLERLLADVLVEIAPAREPERLIPETLRAARRVRRWPRWLALIKEPPMRFSSRVAVGSPTVRLIWIVGVTAALLLAVAAVAVAGASLLTQPVPAPYGPARNGSLIYDQGNDIYLADADGTNSRAIVTGETKDRYPGFSHDGMRILFGRGEDSDLTLVLARADGTDQRELFTSVQWAEFMPLDDEIVTTRNVDGRLVLSMVSLDGDLRDIDVGDVEVAWWVMPRPPDGRELIFLGTDRVMSSQLSLMAIGVDGTGLRTIGASAPAPTSSDDFSFGDPTVSPDGSMLAYWGWERQGELGRSEAYSHVRDLDSGEDRVMPWALDAYGVMPRFSPDSTMIVIEAHAKADVGNIHKLFVAPVDGSGPGVPITANFESAQRQAFDFSPDGTKVVLTAYGRTSIIDVATGDVTELDAITAVPAWQRLAP